MLLQSALNSRLGRIDNAHFLEQFRYVIVASQLLNEHANLTSYNPLRNSHVEAVRSGDDTSVSFTWRGLSLTTCGAFAAVWSMQYAQSVVGANASKRRLCLAFSAMTLAGTLLYMFLRRQWLQYLRSQAIEAASALVTNAQNFDTTTSAAMTLISEVELVSRGYRM